MGHELRLFNSAAADFSSWLCRLSASFSKTVATAPTVSCCSPLASICCTFRCCGARCTRTGERTKAQDASFCIHRQVTLVAAWASAVSFFPVKLLVMYISLIAFAEDETQLDVADVAPIAVGGIGGVWWRGHRYWLMWQKLFGFFFFVRLHLPIQIPQVLIHKKSNKKDW